MNIFIPRNIKIVVEDDNGETRFSQSYSEYLSNPSRNINLSIYGGTLLDVLVEESLITETLQLRQIFTGNPYADATRLIGSIAESLVVKACNSNMEVNRILGRIARGGVRNSSLLDGFVAVATGSQNAKNLYPQYYNPCDTQRDIIWVDKNDTQNQLLCITPNTTSNSAKPAGIQVKASHDGLNYVVNSITDYHYPVLYFDLNNDFEAVQHAIQRTHQTATLIHPSDLQHELKDVLNGYFKIVVDIINGSVPIQRIIDHCKWNGLTEVLSGINASGIDGGKNLILPPSINGR
ncbi:TPA: hypothetical protein ACXGJI_005436 [Klebsiella pneumoniae]